jgi:hypothetical protein
VSPYTCLDATTVSPLRSSVTSVVAIAAIPLAVINDRTAPCNRATSAPAASTVGLLKREYHVSRSPPVVCISA